MSGRLPADARAIALDGDALLVSAAPAGEGTPVSGGRGQRYRWLWFGAHSPGLDERAVERLFDDPSGFAGCTGVWAFFAVDTSGRRTLCAADRLGIQAIYHRTGSSFFSTDPMWLLEATGHDGSYSPEGLEDHLGFGYAIHPERQLYRDVVRLPPASCRIERDGQAWTTRYWSGGADSLREPDVPRLVNILREACSSAERESWFGLTAGKDSLCLASVAPFGRGLTFGNPASADQIQGREVASAFGWEHRASTLCGPTEFADWVGWIARYSAGLTTASYADMLDAIGRAIPAGGAFVMGEAGECVRDFFRPGRESPVEYLAANYVTPVEFLRRTLSTDAQPEPRYPHRLLDRAELLTGDPAQAALGFYRNCRMSGNFAQRNAVIAPLRTKLAPFADSRFIDGTYGLDPSWFLGSRLHREIIAQVRPEFLPFFDAPKAGGGSPQDWPARMGGPLRETVLAILEEAAPSLPSCWDVPRLLAFAREQTLPPRATYFLLRALPLAVAAKLLKTQHGSNVLEPCVV